MHHLILPRRETEVVTGLLYSGLRTQTGYHQGNQVPGSPPVTLSMCACPQGWKFQGTERANKQGIVLVSSCPVWSCGPLTTLLSAQNLFPLLLLQRWLTLATDAEAWWPVYNSQSADPKKPSLVFCLFLPNQIHKSKSPKNMTGSPLLKAFKLPRSFFSIKEGTHPLNPA